MAVIIFVLGCPGCGKSTAARIVKRFVRKQSAASKWSACHLSDYKILYDLYKANNAANKFRETEYDGFDILDPKIYNFGLIDLKNTLLHYGCQFLHNWVFLVEFARCDYLQSFELLGKNLLIDSYFLFIDADINSCVQRIDDRVLHRATIHDHFVSDFVLECYRQQGRQQYLRNTCSYLEEQGVDMSKITIINNDGECSKGEFYRQLEIFSRNIINIEDAENQSDHGADANGNDKNAKEQEPEKELTISST